MTSVKMTPERIAALRRLETENGRLLPRELWESARSPRSPFHDAFDWDVDNAAAQYWDGVARNIINSYRVMVSVTDTTRRIVVPAFVHDPLAEPGESAYKSTEVIQGRADQARIALLAKAVVCQSHVETLANLAEYWGVDNTSVALALDLLSKFALMLAPEEEVA